MIRRFSFQNPKPTKTCAVLRYGAFGDAIQATSILPWLKQQGYHITMYCVPASWEVIKHDPHIDEAVLQDEEDVPNHELGSYWDYISKKYDRFINLSESIERSLLTMPGTTSHRWPHAMRHKYLNHNYLEFTHDIAEVPLPSRIKFYATQDERNLALERKDELGGKVVLWVLSGSAVHKVWPYMDVVIDKILSADARARFVLVGDVASKMLQEGWEGTWQVLSRAGEWSVRETMAFAQVADLVVGPETGVMNAVALERVPKIVTLSHSSVENLTRSWINTVSLVPLNTPCYPCHRIHFNFTHCVEREGMAACQLDIPAEKMIAAIRDVL
jgi:ADP-heptose:LPS heptosyltransferase